MKNVVIKKLKPDWIGKNCVCLKCGSTWEMEESDAPNIEESPGDPNSADQRERVTVLTIKCPGCGADFYLGTK